MRNIFYSLHMFVKTNNFQHISYNKASIVQQLCKISQYCESREKTHNKYIRQQLLTHCLVMSHSSHVTARRSSPNKTRPETTHNSQLTTQHVHQYL